MNLLFGVHNHQPVGNFEHVFKKAARDCYCPFAQALYNYPQVKATLHFSGSLIDWLLKNEPGLLEKVKEMVKRGQVEILTGGYYEPILSIIPERDRLGQINMLSSFIRDYFEYEPRGMWLAERVWQPQLVKSLSRAGVKYTLLDDFHFRYAGVKEKNLSGYYVTEEQGCRLAVFPISKDLRYSIPFSAPSWPIEYFRSKSRRNANAAAIIVDDGEKFGLWPGTHKWVYGKKWLEKFFQLLLTNEDWLKTETISEYMQKHEPLGCCHIPPASYEEMMSWCGGPFENFFVKYPEANNLHKRMLYVSERVNRDCFASPPSGTSLAMTEKDSREARRYLYKGQCNCSYGHGVFGGIYLGHIRHAAYKNLIIAQSLIEKKRPAPWVEAEVFDFDKDGADEIILKNPLLNIFVAPRQGGAIFELDYKPGAVNLTDAMTRRPEAYHEKIKNRLKKSFPLKKKVLENIHDLLGSKEKGLEKFLIYDSYRRLSLLDHFFPAGLTLEGLKDARYEELGDFINAQYSVRQKKENQAISLILQREGKINYNGKKIPLAVSKELSLNAQEAQFSIKYQLRNLSAEPLDIVFGVEFNISDAGRGDAAGGIERAFHFDKKTGFWTYPLETVSASESGFERNYQQTVILLHWPLRLETSWETRIYCNPADIWL